MWTANAEDFRAYWSRLKTFFLERPHVAAAAFSCGGIAWRIALEVLGFDGSEDTWFNAHPGQRSSVSTRRGQYWFHNPDEGEWFYLVGGYEILTGLWFLSEEPPCAHSITGKGDQRKDLSWWPKVTAWEGSGIDVGCWTPMCKRWYQKHLESIKEGKGRPYSSAEWTKNLRYGKETKKFFTNWKNIGQRFLMEECGIRRM